RTEGEALGVRQSAAAGGSEGAHEAPRRHVVTQDLMIGVTGYIEVAVEPKAKRLCPLQPAASKAAKESRDRVVLVNRVADKTRHIELAVRSELHGLRPSQPAAGGSDEGIEE